MTRNGSPKQVKVVFPLETGAETMWADDLTEGTYKLDNVPLFAYDINLHDIFVTRRVPDDERPYFDHVLKPSGNRTVRVTLSEEKPTGMSEAVEDIRGKLESASNGFERYGDDYLVYSVPHSNWSRAIVDLLDKGEDAGFWTWELTVPE